MPKDLNDLRISEAEAEDLPDILALQKKAYRSEALLYNDFSIQPLLQNETEIKEELNRGVILKATEGKRLIGSVRAVQENDSCQISKLMVLPEYESRGIGRQLMGAIEKNYPKVKRFELFTGHQSTRNLTFYHLMGYREFKRRRLSDNLTLVYLEKSQEKKR